MPRACQLKELLQGELLFSFCFLGAQGRASFAAGYSVLGYSVLGYSVRAAYSVSRVSAGPLLSSTHPPSNTRKRNSNIVGLSAR